MMSQRRSCTALSDSSAARDELFGFDETTDDSVRLCLAALSPHQKAALLSNTDRLNNMSRKLDDGRKLLPNLTHK